MSRKLKIDTGGTKLDLTAQEYVRDHIWLSGQVDVDAGDDIESQTLGPCPRLTICLQRRTVLNPIW